MKMVKLVVTLAIAIVMVSVVLVPMIPNNNGSTLEVLVIAGQSNAEYGKSPVTDPEVLNEDYTAVPTHTLLYYGNSTQPVYAWRYDSSALYSMYDEETSSYRIGGYEPILANTLAEKYGHDTLVINTGVGAQTISSLNPANGGTYGKYVKNTIDNALKLASAEYDHLHMVGHVWIQGESDAYTPIAEYIEQFNETQDFYGSYGLAECFVVHTRNYYGGLANQAIAKIINDRDDVHLVTEITETFSVDGGQLDPDGPIHYNQHGRDIIALAIKDKIEAPTTADYSPLWAAIPLIVIAAIVLIPVRFFFKRDD